MRTRSKVARGIGLGFYCSRGCVCRYHCPRYSLRPETEDGHHESGLADHRVVLRTRRAVVLLAVRPSRTGNEPRRPEGVLADHICRGQSLRRGCTVGDFAGEWVVFLTGFTVAGSVLWADYGNGLLVRVCARSRFPVFRDCANVKSFGMARGQGGDQGRHRIAGSVRSRYVRLDGLLQQSPVSAKGRADASRLLVLDAGRDDDRFPDGVSGELVAHPQRAEGSHVRLPEASEGYPRRVPSGSLHRHLSVLD